MASRFSMAPQMRAQGKSRRGKPRPGGRPRRVRAIETEAPPALPEKKILALKAAKRLNYEVAVGSRGGKPLPWKISCNKRVLPLCILLLKRGALWSRKPEKYRRERPGRKAGEMSGSIASLKIPFRRAIRRP